MSDRKAQLREGLARDRQFLLDAIAALSEDDMARPCGHASDWTVKDLIGHIAYAEGSMIPLAQGGVAGDAHKQPPDFDIDRWNESRVRRARSQSLPELLARLATSREQLLSLLDTLTDADLARPVYHPTQKDTTVEGIFRIIAGHERLHGEELRAAAGTSTA
jgi:uncharacterized protein (TIGR03083 family)